MSSSKVMSSSADESDSTIHSTNQLYTPTHSANTTPPPILTEVPTAKQAQPEHDSNEADPFVATEPLARNAASLSSEDVVIAIMGVTGSGKSTFISLLADQPVTVGHGLESCTGEVGVYSLKYDDRRWVYLIDTPGFDDTTRSDTDVLKDIAFFLSTVYHNKVRLAGIIYLHRITDPRMGGSALKNLHMFQRLCGDRGLSSVILATTMWAGLEGMDAGNEIGSNREKELHMPQFWGSMFDRGSEIVRHDGTVESARTIISRLVDRKAQVVLDIQVQLVDQNKTLDETSAGEYIQKELLDARKRFEKDIEEYQESMEAAMQEKDDVMLQALKKEKEGAEAKEKARLEAWQKLNITVQQLTQEKDQQYRKLAETLEKNERSNVQLQNDRQSQNEMFEAQMQEFQKTMRDGERRHLQELEQLKKTQVSQSASEIQRISRVMEERERLWNEEKRHLQHKLDRERRIRQEDEYRLERRLSRSIDQCVLM